MLNQLSKLQKISSLTDDRPKKRKVANTSMETDVGINPYKKKREPRGSQSQRSYGRGHENRKQN
jgi:hypothetical protein